MHPEPSPLPYLYHTVTTLSPSPGVHLFRQHQRAEYTAELDSLDALAASPPPSSPIRLMLRRALPLPLPQPQAIKAGVAKAGVAQVSSPVNNSQHTSAATSPPALSTQERFGAGRRFDTPRVWKAPHALRVAH